MMGSSIKNSHDVTISQITDEQSTGIADNRNHDVVLISEVRESEAGRAVPIDGASTTRIINGNDNVGLKLHNITRSSDVLSDSLFNAGNIVPRYQINASILSESHVDKPSDSHASLASSSNDKSLLDSQSQAIITTPSQLIGINNG
jgi:hypothetical protein